MNYRSLFTPTPTPLLIGFLLSSHAVALDLYWDADGAATTATGGTGTWNTTAARWRTGSSTGPLGIYDNTSPSSVITHLENNGGSVMLASGPAININNLIFDAIEGYEVTGGALNFSGTSPTIDNFDGRVTISSAISGSGGINLGAEGLMPLVLAGNLTGLSGAVSVKGATALQPSTFTGGENQTWQIQDQGVLSALNAGSSSTVRLGALEGQGILRVEPTDGGAPPAGTNVFEVGALGTATVFSGTIEDSGGDGDPDIARAALSKVGGASLTLSGFSAYTGNTTVNGGTLKLASGGAAGAIQGVIEVKPGTVLSLEATDALGYAEDAAVSTVNVIGASVVNAMLSGNLNQGYLTSFSLTGGAISSLGSGPFLFNAGAEVPPKITSNASNMASTITSNLYIASGSLNIGVAAGTTGTGADLSITSILFGPGGFTKTGIGILKLSGFNQFVGATEVNEGTIVIAPGGGLYQTGTQPGTVNVAAGALIRFDRNDSLGGSGVTSPVTVHVNGGTLASNGFYTSLSNPFFNGATLLNNGGPSLGFPAFSIRGTVTVGGSSASNINVGAGNFNNVTLGTLGLTDSTIFNVADATNSPSSDLNVNTFFSNQNINGGANGLVKNGPGTMTLTGVNTYTGETVVNAGTLTVNGSLLAASKVTVADGGILAGSGTVNGLVTTSGLTSSIEPGSFETGEIGTLNVGSTVLTGKLKIQIAAANTDLLNVSGDLNVTGAAIVFAPVAALTSPKYVVAKYTGNLTGTFSSVTLPPGYTLNHDTTQKEVFISGGGGAGFSTYMNSFTGLGEAAKTATADPDGDGISNLLEYSLAGLDPTINNASPSFLSNGLISFSKRPLAVENGDVSYSIETSTTLGALPSPWTAVAPTSNTSTVISYQMTAGFAKYFVRLNVSKH